MAKNFFLHLLVPLTNLTHEAAQEVSSKIHSMHSVRLTSLLSTKRSIEINRGIVIFLIFLPWRRHRPTSIVSEKAPEKGTAPIGDRGLFRVFEIVELANSSCIPVREESWHRYPNAFQESTSLHSTVTAHRSRVREEPSETS